MADKIVSKFFRKLIPHRLWVQTSFLFLWLDPLSFRMHNICSPVFHCHSCPLATFACPIGAIAQFSALHIFPFLALGILIFVGAFLGSLICGWVCPFGLLQDLAAKIPTPRFKIPRWAGYGRFIVLIGTVLLIPFIYGKGHWAFFCRLCPAGALEDSVPGIINAASTGQTITWPNPIKITIFIVLLVAILFTIRPWCRVLCPLGGFFALFNKFSIFKMHLDDKKCTKCNRCRTLCTYSITPDTSPNDTSCIRCLECTRCGPGALTASTVFHDNGQLSDTAVPKENTPSKQEVAE